MVGEGLADAEAMTTCGVEMHGGGYSVVVELFVVVEAVDGQYHTVVVSQGQEAAGGVLADVLLVAILVDQLAWDSCPADCRVNPYG